MSLANDIRPLYKYFNPDIPLTQNQVTYVGLSDKGEILVKSGEFYFPDGQPKPDPPLIGNSSCFGNVFCMVHKDTKSFFIFHPIANMPYADAEITRYVIDLCEMGFACSYATNADHAIFEINMANMETKGQFCSTLTLIRTLFEEANALVPELYFLALDKNPQANKFEALQNAHKDPNVIRGTHYFGLGHNVTNSANGSNVTLEELFKRFKSLKQTPFDQHDPVLNAAWKLESTDKEIAGRY